MLIAFAAPVTEILFVRPLFRQFAYSQDALKAYRLSQSPVPSHYAKELLNVCHMLSVLAYSCHVGCSCQDFFPIVFSPEHSSVLIDLRDLDSVFCVVVDIPDKLVSRLPILVIVVYVSHTLSYVL